LEQPVLLTFLAVVLWFMRDHWPQGHWRWVPIGILLLTVLNVFFVMTGRSGFLVMLVFISMAVWWQLPKRWRWLVVGLPFVLAALMMVLSPRFQTRTTEVVKDVLSYRQGSIETSQAQRFENNFRLVKMVFPVQSKQEWNPLLYVDPLTKVDVKGEPLELFKGWKASIKNLDQSWNQYPNTLEIQFSNYENAIELRRGTERYAANVGLVYRELSVLNTQCLPCQGQAWEKKAQSGFILKMRRI
jgi:hypothetical protein